MRSLVERQKIYNDHCEFEDKLINSRIGWMLAAESLLFISYATIKACTRGQGSPQDGHRGDRSLLGPRDVGHVEKRNIVAREGTSSLTPVET